MYLNELFFKASERKEKDLKCLRAVKWKAASSSHFNEHKKYASVWGKRSDGFHPNPPAGFRNIPRVLGCKKKKSIFKIKYSRINYKSQTSRIILSDYPHRHSQGWELEIKELLSVKALNLQLKQSVQSRGEWECIFVSVGFLIAKWKIKRTFIHEETLCSTSFSLIQTLPLGLDRLSWLPRNCVLSCGPSWCNPVRNPLISGIKGGFASISPHRAA